MIVLARSALPRAKEGTHTRGAPTVRSAPVGGAVREFGLGFTYREDDCPSRAVPFLTAGWIAADLSFDLFGQPDFHQRLVGNISFMGRDLDLFK